MKFPKNIENTKAGTTRVVRKFAWLPTKVVGAIVWLGWYETLQVFRVDIIEAEMSNQNVIITKKYWDVVEQRAS